MLDDTANPFISMRMTEIPSATPPYSVVRRDVALELDLGHF